MNAVNWLKRRVSLSSTPSTPLQTQPTNPTTHTNISTSPKHSRQKSNEPSTPRPSSVNNSARSMRSSDNSGPVLMQHEVVDPSLPLSILAATSRLTTFPYGELQALNARMGMESAKVNGVTLNGVHGIAEVNGVSLTTASEVVANGIESMSPTPLQKHKTRGKERTISTAPQTVTKSLLPSSIPPPARSSMAAGSFSMPLQLPNTSLAAQTNNSPVKSPGSMTTSALPRTRVPPVSQKKSASLSSVQNTRSNKRIKLSHPVPDPPPISPQPPNLDRRSQSQQKDTTLTPPPKERRVLPVRHGHIDILDGEISLLSTPQKLDSRPSFPLSHKIILVHDFVTSTPTTRYQLFSASSIPDPNTSPTTTRPKSIPAPVVTLRPQKFPSKLPPSDPLPDSLFLKPHRKHEFTEIRLRNREREKIDYESSLLERQLSILKSEDWRKIVAPAAAEREGLKEGEEWDWEGRRERRIALLDAVLKRVRTWREAEIKMRKGILDGTPDEHHEKEEEKEEGEGEEEPQKKRKRKTDEAHEEPPMGKDLKEGKEGNKGGRRKQPTAFGQVIPKAGLLNREFQIPLEWVPEERRF